MQTWSFETATGYLRRESGRADLSEADARTLAEALGGLPFALAHAAASLRGMRMVTPARYLERISAHLKNAPRGAEYPRSVFATFTTAIAQAEKEAGGAAALLCFAASFAPERNSRRALPTADERLLRRGCNPPSPRSPRPGLWVAR